jgi:hypothetical protein
MPVSTFPNAVERQNPWLIFSRNAERRLPKIIKFSRQPASIKENVLPQPFFFFLLLQKSL